MTFYKATGESILCPSYIEKNGEILPDVSCKKHPELVVTCWMVMNNGYVRRATEKEIQTLEQ